MDFIRSKFTLFLHCEQNGNPASSYSETYNIIQKIDLFVLLKSKSVVQIHIPRNVPYLKLLRLHYINVDNLYVITDRIMCTYYM